MGNQGDACVAPTISRCTESQRTFLMANTTHWTAATIRQT